MKEFVKLHSSEITVITSLTLITILTGILITATGKILVLEFDWISGHEEDSEGNFTDKHIDGGRLKFYAE